MNKVDEDKNLGAAVVDRETEQGLLLPCPFCGATPTPLLRTDLPKGVAAGAERQWVKIVHADSCFIALLGFDDYPIHRDRLAAWNARAV